jgi:phosphatidylserine/phosphatidylglycerophosphate/cardiolipin synthase-like enzyme
MTHNKVLVLDTRHIFPGTSTQAALMLNKELSVLIYSTEMASEVLSFLER